MNFILWSVEFYKKTFQNTGGLVIRLCHWLSKDMTRDWGCKASMQQITELGFYLLPQPYLLQFCRASTVDDFRLFLWEPAREYKKVKSLSRVWLFATPWTTRLLRPWDFPGKNTGVGCRNGRNMWCSRRQSKKLNISGWRAWSVVS